MPPPEPPPPGVQPLRSNALQSAAHRSVPGIPIATLWQVAPLRFAPSHASPGSSVPFPQVVLSWEGAGEEDSSDPQLTIAAVIQSDKNVPSLKPLLIVA